MGTYCELYIADYPVYSTKSEVDPVVMTIFREGDKRIFKRKVSERNSLTWSSLKDDERVETVYEYSHSVACVRQRLDVMGFTLKQVRTEFEARIGGVKEDLEHTVIRSQEHRQSESWQDLCKRDDNIRRRSKEMKLEEIERLNIIRDTTFQDWLHAFHEIVSKKISPYKRDVPKDEENLLIKYILGHYNSNEYGLYFPFHFPSEDLRSLLRIFVEVSPDGALVTQDITDLVHEGYYAPDEAVCEEAVKALTRDYPTNEKIIVLTEGSTDKEVLEKSLKLLYPHLCDYYSFMDFGISNASGGASSLVAAVKSFVGSGIGNRIIAIFDNDTAAHTALRGLNKTKIPGNIKVLNYPYLEFAKNYPTLGPAGINNLDVNGLACSIELYFGSDILIDNDDGSLVPVQWKGYDVNLEKYQGEILNKNKLQKDFFDKLSKCTRDTNLINQMDWNPIKLVLNHLFDAFN